MLSALCARSFHSMSNNYNLFSYNCHLFAEQMSDKMKERSRVCTCALTCTLLEYYPRCPVRTACLGHACCTSI